MLKQAMRNIVVATLRSSIEITGETGRRLLAEATAINGDALLQSVENVPTKHGDLKFYCLGDLAIYRARSLFTKEPETIDWIDSFSSGETLWDVGANVGIYSIYAAAAGMNVIAFEPGAANYILINKSIEANSMADSITAYCVALSDKTCVSHLNMTSTRFGSAFASFGSTIGEGGEQISIHFKQGMLGFTADDFLRLYSPKFPNHIKIDVDGLEQEILTGAATILSDPRLKSVSIEMDTRSIPRFMGTMRLLESAGLSLDRKETRHKYVNNYRFRR